MLIEELIYLLLYTYYYVLLDGLYVYNKCLLHHIYQIYIIRQPSL